jgi:hypothetical protein
MNLINSLGDLFYLLLFILAIVILFSMTSNKKYNNNGKSIKYYIKPPPSNDEFLWETRRILTNSSINNTHHIEETLNPNTADIHIELAPRDEMAKMYDKDRIEYYPGTTDRIWFSFTTQRPNPRIYIDEINWLYGVKQSGLSISDYRKYVIQHEFMHALGYDHQPCNTNTATNGVCPVLYQSTRGCPSGFKCGFNVTLADYDSRIPGSYF